MRVRQYAYKIWKTGKNRKHKLRLLGVPDWQVRKFSFTSRSYWKEAKILGTCLTNIIMHTKRSKIDINAINLVDGMKTYIIAPTKSEIKESCLIFSERRKYIKIIGVPTIKACDGNMYWFR